MKPELLDTPNVLVTAEAAQLGSADTTPDNLYMIGTFRLAPDEALVLEFEPPDTRYWTVTLENIWHECIDPRRRRSSITNAAAVADDDGKVRVVVSRDRSRRRQLARHRRPPPRLADHPLARPPRGTRGEDPGRARRSVIARLIACEASHSTDVGHRRFRRIRARRRRMQLVVRQQRHAGRPSSTTTTVPAAKAGTVLFSPEGNNLWAYETTPPFRAQKVNAANHSFGDAPSDPEGMGHQRPDLHVLAWAASAT